MTNIKACNTYNGFVYYLKSHFIKHCEDTFENTKRLTMPYTGYANCPGMALESCIYFHFDCMECRVYFSELASDICKNSTHQADLHRLLNYINATVWPRVSDGFEGEYRTPYLHTPRIYITEDGYYDITATSMISYDFYEISPIITADYITACIPELMDKLSPAIFGVLGGKITTEDAIAYVNSAVLNEE